jgi:hypothetical protein
VNSKLCASLSQQVQQSGLLQQMPVLVAAALELLQQLPAAGPAAALTLGSAQQGGSAAMVIHLHINKLLHCCMETWDILAQGAKG